MQSIGGQNIKLDIGVLLRMPHQDLGRLAFEAMGNEVSTEAAVGRWLRNLGTDQIVAFFDACSVRDEKPATAPAKKAPAKKAKAQRLPTSVSSHTVTDTSVVPKDLAASPEVIVGLLKAKPGLSAAQIQSETSFTPGQVKGALKRLRDAGTIKVEGKNKGARYSAIGS